ncbi:tetratricopeptide repeat protein, partial [Microcoleus sp. BR0-C5]|uniref:tetratricopeptide repeat protein n=1 Tax=Microcoleus sp. BR0-C5 TaxID=2818713 RepID=UPI002FCE9DC5
ITFTYKSASAETVFFVNYFYWTASLGDEDNNLEIAINYYQMALQVNTRQINPENWAMIQNNLGNAYRRRSIQNEVENLEMAIFYYKSALEFYTQKNFPEDWAMVQLNLGYAYSDRT